MKRIFFVVILMLCFTWRIEAVEALGISPVIYDDIQLDPGAAVTKTWTLINDSKQAQTYYFFARNFSAKGDSGEQEYRDESIDLQSWISFPTTSLTVASGQSADAEFTITAPSNADPGGHYAAVFASTAAPNDQSAIGIQSSVGLPLLVKISGEAREAARISEFGLSSRSFHDRLPAYFNISVENSGTVHFKPRGSIVVRNMLGGISGTVPANPRAGSVLPGSVKRLDPTWIKTADFNQTVRAGFVEELKKEWRNFGLGRYSAEVTMDWSPDQSPLVAKTTFWLWPWRVMVVGVFGLGLLVALFLLYLRIDKLITRGVNIKRKKENERRKK